MPKPPIDPNEDYPEITSTFIKPMTFFDEEKKEEEKVKQAVSPMSFFAKEKSVEEKIYIILYIINTDDESDTASKTFEVCIGRTAAYSDIKEKLISGLDIDVHRSLVITETIQTETKTGDTKYYLLPFEEAISVYSFCIAVSSYYNTDEFDIEDYSEGDVPEERITYTKAYMTPEQIEYKNMLEESIQHNKFISDMRENINSNNLI